MWYLFIGKHFSSKQGKNNQFFRQILSHYMKMCYEKRDYTRAQDIYENICSKGIPLTKGFVHDLKFKLAIQTKICRTLTINQKWILYIFFRYYFSPKYSNKLSKLQDSDHQKVIFFTWKLAKYFWKLFLFDNIKLITQLFLLIQLKSTPLNGFD